jgi:hypothetical protein
VAAAGDVLSDGAGDLAEESASDHRASGSALAGECSAGSSSYSMSVSSVSGRTSTSFSASISALFSVQFFL